MRAIFCLVFLLICPAFAEPVSLVVDGKPNAVICVPERLLDDREATPEPISVWRKLDAESNRLRLRESVFDLAGILERATGAKVEIQSGPAAAGDERTPILIGELAEAAFGKPAKAHPEKQGFRMVVKDGVVGLMGESDLATSYAIYTLLDQLGCRWFMPGEIGEVLPDTNTIELAEQDVSTGPHTVYRGLWYCDNDFARRNRLGGLELSAGHAFEAYVSKELRESNPEIRAVINGEPHHHLLKWTHPLVIDAVANAILGRLEKNPDTRTFSLSPADGASWDEAYDPQHDADDFDTTLQTVAKTDRLIYACNRIAEKVTAKYPDVRFGVLAYVDYTRPPVREKLHPNIVPQIAPITFARNHPMTADEPNNESLRYLVKGWGQKAKDISYYFYGFNLANPAAPHPFITKWGVDLPMIYENGCTFWQPETLTNFETAMHAHWLGLRMAWNPEQKPEEIIDELHTAFYGDAAEEMAAYWKFTDSVWVNTPEYSGCGFGHLRRFTPEREEQIQQLLAAAETATNTPIVKQRIEIARESLDQFRLFMKLRRDLAEGRFENLAADAKRYYDRTSELGKKHEDKSCFGKMGWTRDESLYGRYFRAFYQKTYDDATRIATDFEILTKSPIRNWRFRIDPDKKGETEGWAAADFADSGWDTTDVAVETWSTLGHHNYMGSMWYRTEVEIPAAAGDAKTWLWIGATDGHAKVFVNGQHIPFVDDKGESQERFNGFCKPASFEISSALRPGSNKIAIFCEREFVNELGTGGLLSPCTVYRGK